MTTAVSDPSFIVDRLIAPIGSIVTHDDDTYLVHKDRTIGYAGSVAPYRCRIISDLPRQRPEYIKLLTELLDLKENWDSYGAAPIGVSHVESAINLLQCVMQCNTPLPAIVPTSRGGVQLEWRMDGIDLEVETLSSHRFLVSFEDDVTDEEWEQELDYDYSKLMQAITLLAERSS